MTLAFTVGLLVGLMAPITLLALWDWILGPRPEDEARCSYTVRSPQGVHQCRSMPHRGNVHNVF